MKLSQRLEAVASLVSNGSFVADVGTDHAYIPIFLAKHKKAPYVLALDVNDGPLEIASRNIKESGYENIIEVRKSDGITNLAFGEVDSIVIAGMGGNLIKNILLSNLEVVKGVKECILQPQSEISKLRSFLVDNKFNFIDEDIVKEDGKYYFIMKVTLGGMNKNPERIEPYKADDSKTWSLEELTFGKHLLMNKNSILREYLLKEKQTKMDILVTLESEISNIEENNILEMCKKEHMKIANKKKNIYNRRKEILAELNLIKGGLLYYDV